MPFDIDPGMVIPIILAALGCNLVCLIIMLAVRPARRSAANPAPGGLPWGIRVGAAEAGGTFLLVFVAMLGLKDGAYLCGLVLAALVAALGPTSGANLNPAVTLGLAVTGRLHPGAAVWYWVCQVAGALGAAAVHRYTFGPATLALPNPESLPVAVVILLEALGTGLLVLAVFGTACRDDRAKVHAPLAIGAALAVAVAAVGPYTGGILNPARYFGPALLSGSYGMWGVYLAGPLLGGVVAAVFAQFFLLDPVAWTEDTRPRLFEEERRAA